MFREALRINFFQQIRGYGGCDAADHPGYGRGKPTTKKAAQWLRLIGLTAQRIDDLDAAKTHKSLG